jgi:hypothetical protein
VWCPGNISPSGANVPITLKQQPTPFHPFYPVQGGINDFHPCDNKFGHLIMLCVDQVFLHSDEDGAI